MGNQQQTTHENVIDVPLDPEELRRQGHLIVDFIADYYRTVEEHHVLSQAPPGYLRPHLPDSAPPSSEPLDAILQDFRDHILPGLTHWQSPNFFAYFPCGSSVAGILGEMLGAGLNINPFNWSASPAATELEMIVVDWLGKMLSLPKHFLFAGGGGGVLQGTTCEAVLCTLTAARDKVLGELGRDRFGDLVVYCSDQTHSGLKKAATIAGIRAENIRVLPTHRRDAFALSPEVLRDAMEVDVAAELVPLYLCATVGTTASTAVDPLRGLCAVAAEHGVWVHVDAAYAGGACICPEFRSFLDGVEGSESFSFNPHKWLFSTLDCCCLWVKRPQLLVNALSSNPEFLQNEATESGKVVDYKDWQIMLSRRFRALKMWMVLRSYGVLNLRAFVRSNVRMAKLFEELVEKDGRFEVVAPRNFATVCFRLLPPDDGIGGGAEAANETNQRLLGAVNATGKVYMTHAVLGGVYVMRFAVGVALTEERHVRAAWEVVQDEAEAMHARGRGTTR